MPPTGHYQLLTAKYMDFASATKKSVLADNVGLKSVKKVLNTWLYFVFPSTWAFRNSGKVRGSAHITIRFVLIYTPPLAMVIFAPYLPPPLYELLQFTPRHSGRSRWCKIGILFMYSFEVVSPP
ncbi:hypothetical protein K438DRAFT_1965995 [Mycena galopus ATCC 62051]|nr:hypothetical protein K438DRAFT_1965995 [Mycena galopus ATCC 62051]